MLLRAGAADDSGASIDMPPLLHEGSARLMMRALIRVTRYATRR